MVTFDHPPADEELQSLLDPEKAPPYLRLVDDGTTLTAYPQPIPMWFFWASMALPTVSWPIVLVWKWDELLGNPDPIVRLVCVIMTVGMVVMPFIGRAFIGWHNRQTVRPDPFFALDRAGGTLTLLRTGMVLRPGDVVELVEVRAGYQEEDKGQDFVDHSGYYLHELSALVRNPDGTVTRHSVAVVWYSVPVLGYTAAVVRVATELAEFFGVPRRKLARSWLRGRWRRVG